MAVDNNAYFRIVWQYSSSAENGKFQQVVSLERSRVSEQYNLVMSEKKAEGKHIVFRMLKISGEHLLYHCDLAIWQSGHLCETKVTFTANVRNQSNIA